MRIGCGSYILILALVLSLTMVGCLRSADGGESVTTDAPSYDATESPTESPTETPTEMPTEAPASDDTNDSDEPFSEAPTESPSENPTESTAEIPTDASSEAPTETVTEAPTEAPTDVPTVDVPETELPLGIYVAENGGYKRVREYLGAWPMNDVDPMWRVDTWTRPGFSHLIFDVAYFGIFPFEDETHPDVDYSAEYMRLWREAGLSGYKIGLEFEIELYDKSTQRFTVLSASDTFKCEEFLEIYLYDDVANATKWWYSHITPETTNANTLITTFKITLREGCYRVKQIRASAFAYKDSNEFDSDGFYTGECRATVLIKRNDGKNYERY